MRTELPNPNVDLIAELHMTSLIRERIQYDFPASQFAEEVVDLSFVSCELF
jgi:hypothetical protein